MKQGGSQRYPWPTTTIAKSSYLRGRIGWQGLKASEFLPEGPYLVTGTDFHRGGIQWDTCYHVSDARFAEAEYIHIRNGDLLVTKDGTIGKIAYVEKCPEKAVLNSGIFVLRCHDGSYDHRYMFYILQSDYFKKFLDDHLAGSTIQHLYQHIFERFQFPVPRKAEQIKISQILSAVDRAIEDTEVLIAKQQRIKTGLMQDLLTRGIDERGNLRSEKNHKFKNSPLGRIPSEWDIAKIEDIAQIETGDKDTQDAEDFGSYPFFVRSQKIERISSYSLDGEAVLTAGDGVGVGKVFHYHNGPFDFHQRVYCIHSFSPDTVGYFVFHYFRLRFIERVSQFSAKGSVESVRMEMISKMLLPKPSKDEQMRSAEILKESESIELRYESMLQKLRSLKASIMHDLLSRQRNMISTESLSW